MGRLARQTLELRQDSDSRLDDPDMLQTRPILVQTPVNSMTRCSRIL